MRRIDTAPNDLGYAIESAREALNVSRSAAYNYSIPSIHGLENPLITSIEKYAETLGVNVKFQVNNAFEVPLSASRELFDTLIKTSGMNNYYYTSQGLLPLSAFGHHSLRAKYIGVAAEAAGVDVKIAITF